LHCPLTRALLAKSSVPVFSPIIILDAGPLKAAVDRLNVHNAWAAAEMLRRAGPRLLSPARRWRRPTHLLRNRGSALDRLRELVERMQVEDPAPVKVLSLMKVTRPRWITPTHARCSLPAATKARWCSRPTSGLFRLSRALRVAERRVPRVRS
jgi:hypothetical protein